MSIGIFGGSFDPVHLGHLILAEQCREQANLDRVLFVPSARPPHKPEQEMTPFRQRVEMLELAISGNPAFGVDELENDRAGPSYTVTTLETLRDRGVVDPWLIIGGDSLADMPMWYQPRRIVELAGLLVVGRPGWEPPADERLRSALGLSAEFPLRFRVVRSPLIEVSSRDLRARIGAGRSVRYQIPRAVEAYIEDKGLYRT